MLNSKTYGMNPKITDYLSKNSIRHFEEIAIGSVNYLKCYKHDNLKFNSRTEDGLNAAKMHIDLYH